MLGRFIPALGFAGVFFAAILTPAQTPSAGSSVGKKESARLSPDFFPGPYELPPMVTVPSGEYAMGDHHDGLTEALPVHDVYIQEFLIDTFEVTNEEYSLFLNWSFVLKRIELAGGVVYPVNGGPAYCDTVASSSYSRIRWNGNRFAPLPGKEDHPLVMVSWYGAAAYANWRSLREGCEPCYDPITWECDPNAGGFRMPTEGEWEKAARGGEQSPYYRFPWGDYTDEGSKANFVLSGDPYEALGVPQTTPAGYYDGGQTPAGADMANGYGLYDVCGNVWEWCNDWYDPGYYSISPYDNPPGPSSGAYKVIRGGAWIFGTSFMHCAYRTYGGLGPHLRYYALGFRLVRPVGE